MINYQYNVKKKYIFILHSIYCKFSLLRYVDAKILIKVEIFARECVLSRRNELRNFVNRRCTQTFYPCRETILCKCMCTVYNNHVTDPYLSRSIVDSRDHGRVIHAHMRILFLFSRWDRDREDWETWPKITQLCCYYNCADNTSSGINRIYRIICVPYKI